MYKNLIKKTFSFMLMFSMIVSFSITANAATLTNSTSTKSLTSTYQQGTQLALKLQKFIKKQGNKVILTTYDTKVLGISKQELADIEKGFAIGEQLVAQKNISIGKCTKNLNTKVPSSSSSDTRLGFSITTDPWGIFVYFSQDDVKKIQAVGIAAGAILGIVGLFCGGDEAIITVGGITVTQGALIGSIGLALSSTIWIWQTLENNDGFTLFLPTDVLATGHGPVGIGPGYGSYYSPMDCEFNDNYQIVNI
jgi:hypothetical protein